MLDAQTIFTTERLLCRRWQASDIEPLFAVYSDSEAMRWVGDGAPLLREHCEHWLEVTDTNYQKRGYGMFALEERETGQVIGFCGIVHPGGQPEAEVKYALLKSHWGKGLATEAVRALLDYGHQTHGLSEIIATVAPANLASQRVLLKSGMTQGELRENPDGSHTQVFIWGAPSA
ncbi:MAG: GNAT family N-acetyltransferase [Armatimonas sp.]